MSKRFIEHAASRRRSLPSSQELVASLPRVRDRTRDDRPQSALYMPAVSAVSFDRRKFHQGSDGVAISREAMNLPITALGKTDTNG